MSTTTIKVPTELRDRLAALASKDHLTLAGTIARSLDAAESAAFWADVAAAMGGAAVGRQTPLDLARLDGSLTDGLDPDEDWSDVW